MIKQHTILYKLLSAAGVKLIAAVEWLNRHNSMKGDIFPPENFQWTSAMEAGYPEMLEELNTLLHHGKNIHDFSMLSIDQQRIVKPQKWKSFVFCAYGNYVEKNCRECPASYKAIQQIPGIKTAMFSVFEPGTHLIPHRGVYNGLLRYHLALVVPDENDLCGIRINDITYHWKKGRSFIFDDTVNHEAWNYSSQIRVVLFVDFERPLPGWLQPFNRFMIWLIGSSPLVKNILTNINRLEN